MEQLNPGLFVEDDRDRGLAVDDLLGHRVAVRAGEHRGHGVSVPLPVRCSA
jgi:hypothetical protein